MNRERRYKYTGDNGDKWETPGGGGDKHKMGGTDQGVTHILSLRTYIILYYSVPFWKKAIVRVVQYTALCSVCTVYQEDACSISHFMISLNV